MDFVDYAAWQPYLNEIGILGQPAVAYDYRDRMVEYNDPATGLRHTYAYDALGRWILPVWLSLPANGNTMSGAPDGTRKADCREASLICFQ